MGREVREHDEPILRFLARAAATLTTGTAQTETAQTGGRPRTAHTGCGSSFTRASSA